MGGGGRFIERRRWASESVSSFPAGVCKHLERDDLPAVAVGIATAAVTTNVYLTRVAEGDVHVRRYFESGESALFFRFLGVEKRQVTTFRLVPGLYGVSAE